MCGVVKTIRLSEEYHAWLRAHKRDDETMEEMLRRLIRGPNPEDVAGLLTSEEAEEAKETVEDLRDRDRSRFEAAREAFGGEGADE
jgi:predicted CopG family antitoxin